MEFDDLQRQWKTEIDRPLNAAESDQFLNDVRQKCAAIERRVRRRDLLEFAGATILVPWIVISWPAVSQTWMSIAGAGLMLIWVAGVVLILIVSRPKPHPVQLPTNEFLRQRLYWCDGQFRLLKNAGWWYVLPSALAALLIAWGKPGGPNVLRTIIFSLVVIACSILIARLNWRAAERHFKGLKDDLIRLRDELP